MNWKLFFATLGAFVAWILILGLENGIERGTLQLGSLYYGYSMVLAYVRLKDAHFIFSKAASKKEWIYFILFIIVIWTLMCVVLIKEVVIYAVSVTHSILIICLIIDRIREWIRKI